MSRCFPFPPPGYEKKVRLDDIDILSKEKHKEKKHKKDKKDKEKREGKEKKEKDRSKEKHREKKDKKEKHKDKKEKNGDNGTARTSEERTVEGQPESSNAQKHGPNGLHNVDIKDYKYMQELDRRYRNDERASGSQQVVPKIMVTEQRSLLSNQFREKERIKDKEEDSRTFSAQGNHVKGKSSAEASVQNVPNIDQRRLGGITKPIEKQHEVYKNGERASGSQVVQKIMVSNQRPLLSNQSREKERIKDKKEDDWTFNAQGNYVKGKGSADAVVQNFATIDQKRLGGTAAKPIERPQEVYRNGERPSGSEVVQKIVVSDQRPLLSNLSGEKERIKVKKEDGKTANAQRNHVESKSPAEAFIKKLPSIDQGRLGGLAKPIEKQQEVYRNGERPSGSQVVQKIVVSDRRPFLSNLPTEKEGIKDEKDERTVNGQWNHVERKYSTEASVRNLPIVEQRRLEGIAKSMEHDVRSKNADCDSKGGKPKERDKEKKSKSKDKNRDSKKEKKEKVEMSKLSAEQPKIVGSSKDSLDAFTNKASDLLQMNGKNSAAGGNLRKRKEPEMNGYLHENGFLPHKLPRPVSSLPIVDNGRKLEPAQTVPQFLSEGQGPASNCKADIKESRINSLRGSEQPNACSTKPSSSSVKVKENGRASTKPPHPDSKYLSEILSIPKIEDESDFDDQEWLFSRNGSESKKPKVGAPEVESTPEVWAEAMQIDSADVFALPYVIPY